MRYASGGSGRAFLLMGARQPRTVPLRVGVVGAGYIANFAHLPTFARLEEGQVVALCDEDTAKAEELAARFGVSGVYGSLQAMLRREELDVVDICVPPHRHEEALVTALRAGLPCLVEKPLTTTTAEADAVLALAREQGCPVYVLHSFSALPGIRRAKALLQQGAVGHVRGMDIRYFVPLEARHGEASHWCHRLPGDYFSEAGPHLAMLLVEFLGAVRAVQTMTAKRSNHPYVRIDEVRLIVEAKGGLGTISCSFNCPARLLTVDIFGTEGALHVDGNYQAVVRYGPIASSQDAFARGLAAAKEIGTRALALTGTAVGVLLGRYEVETYGHRYLIQRALRALLGQGEYPVDLENAREAVRLLELAFADMETPG